MWPKMKSAIHSLANPRLRSVLTAGVLALIEVYIDQTTWIELNVSILYILPLILLLPSRNRPLIWGMALFLVSMTFIVYFEQISPRAFSVVEPFFVDRLLSAVTVLSTAALLHARTLALDKIDAQSERLKERNDQIELANRELIKNREMIAQQNTELDRRRREAEQASGRKTRLLASASHDIRTPVSSINLMAELIRQTAEDPALATEIPGLAQRLQANAQSLVELLSDILDISSFDSGRVELRESEFSLNDLLAEECIRLRPLAHAKSLQLIVEPSNPPIWLRTDRVKLDRILSNLVSNAIKFTQTGQVTVTANRSPDCDVLIGVRDTGTGIAAENLGRIFDEFTQLDNAKHDRLKGSGLGLAICRRIIAVIGGEITVKSQPNVGSTFAVRLPPSCIIDKSPVTFAACPGSP
jgi:signal transduction histidine kinase